MQYTTQLLRYVRLTIGQNIRAARTEQKMTLRKLSRLSGVPEHKLDQYELGKNEIGLEELVRVACVLDLNVMEWLCHIPTGDV